MTDALTTWLRREIEADKAAAEAADTASPGPWVNTGQAGCDDAWQIHGAPTGETEPNWENFDGPEIPILGRVATLNYGDGGGVWEREAADHIVLQQPRDTIARCEFELGEIARHDESAFRDCVLCGEHEDAYPCDYLRRHAYARRHRPGYLPEWAPEGTTP